MERPTNNVYHYQPVLSLHFIRFHEGSALLSCNQIKREPGNEATCYFPQKKNDLAGFPCMSKVILLICTTHSLVEVRNCGNAIWV